MAKHQNDSVPSRGNDPVKDTPARSTKEEIRLRGEAVGEYLRKLRGEITLSELERRTQIDKATLMRFERGERGFSSDELVIIARALREPHEVPSVLKECFAAAFKSFGKSHGSKLFINVLDAASEADPH